jgi:hypothetical protein
MEHPKAQNVSVSIKKYRWSTPIYRESNQEAGCWTNSGFAPQQISGMPNLEFHLISRSYHRRVRPRIKTGGFDHKG